MNLNHPLAVVTPTLDGDVLCILCRVEAEFTPGRVHRMLGGRSEEGVRKVLMRLTEQGIVRRRRAGPSYLYSLNREHLSAAAINMLCQARAELLRRLAAHVSAWQTPPLYGALFGSATRSDMQIHSDLDIFLLRPSVCDGAMWENQTSQLARDATSWTGNDARILEMIEVEFDGMPPTDRLRVSIGRDAVAFWGAHEGLPSPSTTVEP